MPFSKNACGWWRIQFRTVWMTADYHAVHSPHTLCPLWSTYTTQTRVHERHSSPYCCWSLWWISADGTFSPRNLITMRCSTLRGTFCSLITLATPIQDLTGSNPSRREGGGWLHSLKVAQLLRSAACLHTNQSWSYLNHLVPVPNVQWKISDDGQRNCPKHVEFLDRNKVGKISASVGFIKKKHVFLSLRRVFLVLCYFHINQMKK